MLTALCWILRAAGRAAAASAAAALATPTAVTASSFSSITLLSNFLRDFFSFSSVACMEDKEPTAI